MSNVIYLGTANHRCECGKAKAACDAEARRNPALLYQRSAPCDTCGDRVVVEDGADELPVAMVCDDCGQVPPGGEDELESCTIELPYGLGRGLLMLCPECLAERDGADLLRV